MECSGNDGAHHLCVLVHGLWGNPSHLDVMATSLRERHPDENLHILAAGSNCGSRTYDGIAQGGERLCLEIENEVDRLARKGQKIQQFSLIGYSLGGLVGRYAIGLLDSQGFFNQISPVNFTTFASPFLGTRSPVRGWRNSVGNVLGPYAFCKSGRELFMIDSFRDTGKPLLEVLAHPDSIFIRGLAKFERRSLYGNITNDPSAVFYTTHISETDPYYDLDKVKPTYVEGYEDIIVDINGPAIPLDDSDLPIHSRLIKHTPRTVGRALFFVGMVFFVPLFSIILFVTFLVQSFESPRRIYLHETGLAGVRAEEYNFPLIVAGMTRDSMPPAINTMQEAAEDAYQTFKSSQSNEYLLGSEKEPLQQGTLSVAAKRHPSSKQRVPRAVPEKRTPLRPSGSPALALTPTQFSMIKTLDGLGWRKYPVHIHKVRRAHAALIVRMGGSSFDEGRVVFRHWLDEEFVR